jgi:calcineurin-like phosphoesterase family protein
MPQNPGLPAGSPSRVFFTADHHFGHRNIIGLCQRPFADIEEMDAALTATHTTR